MRSPGDADAAVLSPGPERGKGSQKNGEIGAVVTSIEELTERRRTKDQTTWLNDFINHGITLRCMNDSSSTSRGLPIGIHMSLRGGCFWNLRGRDCVVVHFRKGGMLRIGTDDAMCFAAFLADQIKEQGSES